ncbi:MAG: hypothetical protein LUE09_10070 [Synergistaceae bacterium]|nr:hypothetical protein [Synergistaceae bacterium]
MANDIKGNILFSPYNLVMTLMEEYDRANRQTKDRLEKILYLDKDTKENLKLLAEIVNNTPEDSGKFYSSAEKTYFMSDWEFPFYIYENFMKHLEDRFSKVDFYKNEIEKCRVGMMTQSQRVKYYEDCDIKSFEFPFIDRYYSYIIILPKEKWNVRHIERTLSFEKYTLLALKQSDKNLHVRIVDTRISSSYDFSYLLEDSRKKRGEGKKIRQTNIFKLYGGEPSRAIPTLWHEPMNGGKFEMFPLGDIEHFPRIDRFKVDYDFKPEHPFLYFVVDNRSGAILLMGRYCGREQNENILSW